MSLKNTTLDDIAAVVGLRAALRLAAWFGARGNLWVPVCVEEGQLLANLIGISAARQLTAEFGGEHLAVPATSTYEEDIRARQICDMYEHGMSCEKIGKIVSLSERRVQQILRELEVMGMVEIRAAKTPGKIASKLPMQNGPTAGMMAEFVGKKDQGKSPTKMPRKKAPQKRGV